MPVRAVTVLLVGNGARNAPTLEDHLRKRGCEICFATSKKDAMEFVQHRRFDLILSEFMLSDGTAYQFMSELLGTQTTMFVSNAVEDSCWWMTAVFQGQDRSEEPGMRPGQFRIRLDEVLDDQLFPALNIPAGELTHPPRNRTPGFADRTTVSIGALEPRSGSHLASGANRHAES